MCYFITVVAAGLPLSRLNDLALTRRIVFTECHNQSVATQLRPDETYLAHDSVCDCGTELGSKLRTPSKRHSVDPAGPTADDWLTLIQSAMNAGAKRLGLIYHWYTHDVTTETITVARKPVPVDLLTTAMLLELPEDTLVMVTRTGHAPADK